MKKAFTLIELLIVIAIIAILAAILFVSIGQQPLLRSRDAQRVSTIQNLRTALAIYYTQNDFYPADLATLKGAGQIPEVPSDPRDSQGTCGDPNFTPNEGAAGAYVATDFGYYYSLGTDNQRYVLAACLEDTASNALDSDCDDGTLDPACQADPVYDIHS